MIKTCAKCNIPKDANEFSPDNRLKSGVSSYCRSCQTKNVQESYARQTPEQRQKRLNKKKIIAKLENEKYPEKRKNYNLKRHDLTFEQFNTRFESQEFKCAICGTPKNSGRGRFQVDHDHSCCSSYTSCGKCFRGILCSHCNTGLGGFRDNTALLSKAILYLSKKGLTT